MTIYDMFNQIKRYEQKQIPSIDCHQLKNKELKRLIIKIKVKNKDCNGLKNREVKR